VEGLSVVGDSNGKIKMKTPRLTKFDHGRSLLSFGRSISSTDDIRWKYNAMLWNHSSAQWLSCVQSVMTFCYTTPHLFSPNKLSLFSPSQAPGNRLPCYTDVPRVALTSVAVQKEKCLSNCGESLYAHWYSVVRG